MKVANNASDKPIKIMHFVVISTYSLFWAKPTIITINIDRTIGNAEAETGIITHMPIIYILALQQIYSSVFCINN